MPLVEVDGLQINYDVQGEGEPLLLIPYLSADHACYAFQLPAYTEHFRCVALDLPGTGESSKPPGPYATEKYADVVAAFLHAIGIERAHVAGVSLGGAVAMHLAARHPHRVRSLSLHSTWHRTDAYLASVVELWRTLASTLPTIADVVIQAIFPLVFTPEMYVERPASVTGLADSSAAVPPSPGRRSWPRPRRFSRTTAVGHWVRSALRRSSRSGLTTSSAPHVSPSRSRAESPTATW